MASSKKIIISASRRTDIPAFYSNWFIDRLKAGFFYPVNPFNNKRSNTPVSLASEDVRCIVFWTKNPEPILSKLNWLHENNYNYYFQLTINGYGKEIEPGIPGLSERIDSLRRLADKIGRERIVWRYDPILFSKKYDHAWHLEKFSELSTSIAKYTCQIMISMLDPYRKIKKRLNPFEVEGLTDKHEIWTETTKKLLIEMKKISDKNALPIFSCAELLPLREAGIQPGQCINRNIINFITGTGMKAGKDSGQRKECLCLKSVDMGMYNTCHAKCKYCYAV